MIRNYFITALRSIFKNKIQSIIQVVSLAIGITAFLLIGLYARHEMSYDKFNEKFDRIYRLEYSDHVGLPTAPGHQIKQEIPEIENVVRLVNWNGKDHSLTIPFRAPGDSLSDRMIKVEDHFWCDSTIFDVFTFNFIQGDPKTALRDPYSVVLSESTAKKFFGDRNPVGEMLGVNWLTVTGVIEDVKNSHLEVNMLISIVSQDSITGAKRGEYEYLNSYMQDLSFMTYVLLPEGNDHSFVEDRLNLFFTDNMRSEAFEVTPETKFSLRPLKEIYFTTNLKGEKNYCRHGNLKLLRVLLTIAVFVLLLAVVNYINLTTARASLRAKEVGLRKVAGSSRNLLVYQFLVESILVTFLSLLIALAIIFLILPGFNQLASTALDVNFIIQPVAWLLYLISVIILGVVSGLYPAVYLTSFQPVESLYGEGVKGSGSAAFRRFLLTFQFTISVVLIIGVFVIFSQLKYMKTADLGFKKESIINNDYYMWGNDFSKRQIFRDKLLQSPTIEGLAFSSTVMGGNEQNLVQPIKINERELQVTALQVDPDFFDVMEIKLKDGRNFSWDRIGSDFMPMGRGESIKLIMNETAVREFDLESPVGYFERFEGGLSFEIIGVVSDFNFKSLHEKIEPCIYVWNEWMPTASIKVSPEDINGTLDYIMKSIQSIFPGMSEDNFEFTFLEETWDKQYERDDRTARIIRNFAIVAILIACLGLFGLSSFMAARRIKEIGIRKSMGASNLSLFLLLSSEYLKWVVLSILIGSPLAWYIMNRWLQSFAYRTNIAWWVFAVTIVIAFAITFITITWQSLKTARTNPVEALRYE